ncbi:MAG: 8-oxo-dGTP diphosphatase [Lachnospiraceae bacterium]|nr:8-oxo-dGTP diphosphatase [Lachnospiraceae bacterium]
MANEHTVPRLTTLCYAEREDAYLMLHRVKKGNDVNKDKWIGIGGHFEEGESPEECIRREAMEETGLTLQNLRFRGIVTFCFKESGKARTAEEFSEKLWKGDTDKVANVTDEDVHWDDWEYMCLFTATVEDRELADCNEGDLEWVKKDRIEELNLWEGDKIFLRLLEEEAPFFSLKLCYYGDKLVQAVLNGEKTVAGRTL